MKVFISWSGEISRRVADALREWLPDVIQEVEPWVSASDIEAGSRWSREIESELSTTRFGILCLTRDTQHAPWILFEAGALAKTVPDTFVCPYLINFTPAELAPGPLTQFQAKRAVESETWELLQTLNKALKDEALPEDRLSRSFKRCWPDLEATLSALPTADGLQPATRPVEEMVAETLEIVRQLARRESESVLPKLPLNFLTGKIPTVDSSWWKSPGDLQNCRVLLLDMGASPKIRVLDDLQSEAQGSGDIRHPDE
jgi:hypothetical protein